MKNETKIKIIISLEKILKELKLKYLPKPKFTSDIEYKELSKLLKSNSRYAPLVLDRNYKILTQESLAEFLRLNDISEETYIKEENDCDNFAFKTWLAIREWATQASVGVVIGDNPKEGKHAWNILIVDTDGTLELISIEPQTDMFSDFSDKKIDRVIL